MNLSDLKPGQKARVLDVCESVLAGRLQEFGIFAGSLVHLLGTAPSGSPLLLESGGTKLGIRREQALLINIERLD